MSLRLLQILVAAEHRDQAMEILRADQRVPQWDTELADGRVLVQALLPATGNEPVLNELEEAFRETEGYRVIFLPVEATVPRLEDDPADDAPDGEPQDDSGQDEAIPAVDGAIRHADEEVGSKKVRARINREELYTDVSEGARASPYYMAMVALSAVVACSGLMLDDVAVIIGAMVIAPLIGPSMGIALSTALGDLKLGKAALRASVAGVTVAFVLSAGAGLLLDVDPSGAEIAGRTELTWGHLSLALAAGAAGAISLAQGVGAGLVGVMVSVALLPPLAVAGLLIGSGYLEGGTGALLLTAANVVCVNLAATAAFLIQGVRPNTWWEGDRRKRAVWIAGALWGGLLLALVAILALG
jgi:uncharacterized hydrophobic protein (TIGR00341 family)